MEPSDAQLILEKRIQTDSARLSELKSEESIIEESSRSLTLRKQELLNRLHDLDQESGKSSLLAKQYTELVQMDSIYSLKLQDAQSETDRISNDLVSSRAQTVKLLNDESSLITKSQSAVPSENEIRKVKDTLFFKQKNLEKTQETIDRLNYEKEKRMSEVRRIC